MTLADNQSYDLLVIGGGVNGVGIARDAAGRGLKVLLCEKADLASGTSSASTKLIHGGLRYLEQYEFGLVRHALIEREVLLRAAPHIIWPLHFVLPHSPEQRPAWLIRLGLFLYDHLGGRKILPASKAINLKTHVAGGPIVSQFTKAFMYSDCWAEDSRLVALTAMDARERGAEVLTRTECVSGRREDDAWRVELKQMPGEQSWSVRARAVVNTAGPWVTEVLTERLGVNLTKHIRNVKGSHIVVPSLFDHPYPYIFQNVDKRIVFAIPYEGRYTLIGTTDLDYHDDLDHVAITEGETKYLCDAVNRYFEAKIGPEDVAWSYAGVRPLYDDGAGAAAQATREYILELEAEGVAPALLNVYGGKITTHRILAEQAVDKLQPSLGFTANAWTAGTSLPGGDIENADFDGFLARQKAAYSWLPNDLRLRYARSYGTRMDWILKTATSLDDLGADLGGALYEAEVDYLVDQEFAQSADDILWRRSKLGLFVPEGTAERLSAYLAKAAERRALEAEIT